MAALIYLPAGRSIRRSDNAKWVDPQPEKGTIELSLDSGIVNFVWRNKETGRAEDELLIFPGEAEFVRVTADPTGRSFALKFNSSNQVHFFWLQRGTLVEADARATTDIDEFLKNPEYRPGSAPIKDAHRPPASAPSPSSTADATVSSSPPVSTGAAAAAGTARSAEAGPSSGTTAASTSTAGQEKKDSDMARLLYQWAENNMPIPEEEEASLTDILTPSTVSQLLSERPALAQEMAQHMPPDLALPGGESVASAAGLERIVSTPQFRDAVANLEMALRNGTLPESMMPWIQGGSGGGAWNLRSFLAALRDVKTEGKGDEKKDEKKDEMDID